MKKENRKEWDPKAWKRKFMASLSMLLVATILMATTTYAWLVLSTAPEAVGITTNIGANGSLEIALLNTETRNNMSAISSPNLKQTISTVGAYEANTTWGNLIDLSDSRYGLSEMALMPARLQITDDAKKEVSSGFLSVPTYDYDGRIIGLDGDTYTTIYKDSKFSFTNGEQDFGVRAIGTIDNSNSLGANLANAKANVEKYKNDANSAAKSALNSNAKSLFSIMSGHVSNPNKTYNDNDITALKNIIKGLDKSLDYIDKAMRQAVLGYAASAAENHEKFVAAKSFILDETNSLTSILAANPGASSIKARAEKLDDMKNTLSVASNKCNALSGGSYTWSDISPIMNTIMDVDKVYLGDTLVTNLSSSAILGLGEETEMTLSPGSGIPADIADFTGDFDVWYDTGITNVIITTKTTVKPVYLSAISTAMEALKVSDGSAVTETFDLNATYGYALDLAFRTNAANADLQLQTEPVQRVYTDSDSKATQGEGSYMEFSTLDPSFTTGEMLDLMDAVRVGFIDSANKILGIAKLNTSNRAVSGDTIKASLYLYDYKVDEETGAMEMGERKKSDPKITDLEKNVASAVTVVVWLDGDMIDNTMVPADQALSMKGVLNLQFSTSADLVPAANNSLINLSVDKEDLKKQIEDADALVGAGQGTYTTESWNSFIAAYTYAMAVSENENATSTQVTNAVPSLKNAQDKLTNVTHDALTDKIKEARGITGSLDDKVSRLARYDEKEKNVVTIDPAEVKDAKTLSEYTQIKTVDFNKNVRYVNENDKDIQNLIYTTESWNDLAEAIYDAEVFNLNVNATDNEIDAAISALDLAIAQLTPATYYKAYDLNGQIYYYSVYSEEGDTYGNWYDKDFKMVVSDKEILDLDAGAVEADIAAIDLEEWIDNTASYIAPSISLCDKVYSSLKNEEIIGMKWFYDDTVNFSVLDELSRLENLIIEAKKLGITDNPAYIDAIEARSDAEKVLDTDFKPLADALEAAINAAKEEAAANSTGVLVPVGASTYEIVNRVAVPHTVLNLKEDSNLTESRTFKALVLTRNGVIYEASTSSIFYTKASGVEPGDHVTKLKNDASATFTAHLTSVEGTTTTETIESYRWAVSNTNIAKLEEAESDVCRIVPVKAGNEVEITLTVTTVQGNEYFIEPFSVEITYDKADGCSVTPATVPEMKADKIVSLMVKLDGEHTEHIEKITWSSSDESVAVVGSDGNVTAKGGGSATITAKVETLEGNTYDSSVSISVAAPEETAEPQP